MTEKHPCSARRYGDQMQCAKCGLAWDMKDPEPPRCNPVKLRRRRATRNR